MRSEVFDEFGDLAAAKRIRRIRQPGEALGLAAAKRIRRIRQPGEALGLAAAKRIRRIRQLARRAAA
jgi:hypothetical protein